jgi:hypothetical protein
MNFALLFALASPFVAMSAAIVLVVWGLRGHRIGLQPTCRVCQYDLTGRPVDGDRCSECGADLRATSAVQLGIKRRKIPPIVIGILIFFGGGWYLQSINHRAWASAPDELTPTWWLLDNASKAGPSQSDAITRLIHRAEHFRLSDGETGQLAKVILTRNDGKLVFEELRVVESAHEKKAISEQEWDSYVRHSMEITFTVRPKARRDLPVPFRLCARPTKSYDNWTWQPRLLWLEINGVKWSPSGSLLIAHPVPNRLPTEPDDEFVLPDIVLPRLQEGKQIVKATVIVFDGTRESNLIQTTLTSELEVIPATEPATALLPPNPRTSQALRRYTSPSLTTNGHNDIAVNISPTGNFVPAPIFYKAFLLVAGKEYSCGKLLIPKNSFGWTATVGYVRLSPVPASADVIFRPDPDSASHYIEFTEIWGEDLVYLNNAIR